MSTSSRRSIYVIRSEHGSVKIGMATNANWRLHTLRAGSPGRLSLAFEGESEAAAVPAIEARAHALLAASRETGEWFAVSVDKAVQAVMTAAQQLGFEIHRPTPERRITRLHMHMPTSLAKRIDEWRRQQPDLPNSMEAARRLIELALEGEKKGGKQK